MTRLALRFVPHAVEQLLEAEELWRQNRDKAPDLLATEFEEGTTSVQPAPTLRAQMRACALAV
jgi:hypothetical protein